MVEVTENRIVHKVIHDVSFYDEKGHYYSTVIPLNTQVYAMYPNQGKKTDLWYVYGDGIHTYAEIRDGKGNRNQSKEYPVFTKEFIDAINAKAEQTYVDAELIKKQIINNIVTEITEENKNSEEKYTSVKSITEYVDQASNQLTTLINTLNHDLSGLISNLNIIKADKNTVYTRTEIDNMMFSVYKPKGSVRNKEALPTTNNRVGDVYNVISDSMNYVWTIDNEWDALGPIIDLSPYCLKTELTTEINRAQDKENELLTAINKNTSLISQLDIKVDNNKSLTDNNLSALNSKYNELNDKKADTTTINTVIAETSIETLNNANAYTDTKLENYTNTEDMNATISGTKSQIIDQIPTNVSQLNNDSQYTTATQLQEQVTLLTQQIKDLKLLIPTEPNTPKEFVTAMKKSGKVQIIQNTDLSTQSAGYKNITTGIIAKNNTILNLNSHTLTFGNGTCGILVRGSAHYTITGEGTVTETGTGPILWTASESAVFDIYNGNFVSPSSGNECIYCEKGTINIYGGTFKMTGNSGNPVTTFLLNCKDANYKSGIAKINVYGGSFYDFNPADNKSEGEGTNFVAEGYTVTSVEEEGHTIYTVVKA